MSFGSYFCLSCFQNSSSTAKSPKLGFLQTKKSDPLVTTPEFDLLPTFQEWLLCSNPLELFEYLGYKYL
jgi:hypothetical protein